MCLSLRRFFCVLSFAAAGMAACTKDPPRKPVYFNADFKSYFDYKPGSYWILYDSLHAKTDCLYVWTTRYFEPYSNGSTPEERLQIALRFYGASAADTVTGTLYVGAPYYSALAISYSSALVDNLYPADFTRKMPFETGRTNVDVQNFHGYCQRSFLGDIIAGLDVRRGVYQVGYYDTTDNTQDIFRINQESGFVAMYLNNQFMARKYVLVRSNIVK